MDVFSFRHFHLGHRKDYLDERREQKKDRKAKRKTDKEKCRKERAEDRYSLFDFRGGAIQQQQLLDYSHPAFLYIQTYKVVDMVNGVIDFKEGSGIPSESKLRNLLSKVKRSKNKVKFLLSNCFKSEYLWLTISIPVYLAISSFLTELAPVAPNPNFITNRPAVERLAPARTHVQLSDNVELEIQEKAINIIEAEMESELAESRKEQEHETKKKQSQKRKRTQTWG